MLAQVERLYDDFSGDSLDGSRWAPLVIPLGDGAVWRCEEPDARILVADGTLEIRIEPFQRFHDGVQIFDNPKHLLFSTESFPLPERGVIRFSVEMAAENIGGNPDDVRDGFAGFNVVDMASGMVFDGIATSRRLAVVYERLFIPGLIPLEDAFTYVIESPLTGLRTEAGQFHEYRVELDAEHATARWFIDGRLVFVARQLPVTPQEVKMGFGLFTLHPLRDGRSVSLHGQGMIGRWRNFRVSYGEP